MMVLPVTLVILLGFSPPAFCLSRTADTLGGAWPVPLTDILTDYLPANRITGDPDRRSRTRRPGNPNARQ